MAAVPAQSVLAPVTTEGAVAQAIAQAHERYTARNPTSRTLHAQACEVLPGGNTRSVLFNAPFPLVIAQGQGCHLRDADGNDYVDFLGDYTAGLLGHSNPIIRAALDEALDGGLSLSGHLRMEAALAGVLCERFPSIDLVRFTNSGTEANLMAIATAKAATGRKKVLVFRGGYHGAVLQFGAGNSPVNVPHEFVLGRYNDVDAVTQLFDAHGAELAAVLVEPVIGSGGCIPGDRAFLEVLRRKSTQSGVVLIFDEVMTSRLSPGGMQQLLGITPDLTTLGKYIGGGMSFGAFGGRARFMALFDPRRADALQHPGTFNNNVLTMSAGYAGMTKVLTPAVIEAVNHRGDELRSHLNALCRARGVGLEFTGVGSLMTAHFSTRAVRTLDDVAAADPALKELFFFDMLEAGIYLARRGMTALSIEIGDRECDRLVGAVEKFVTLRAGLLGARIWE